jgi:type I restriction enzyme, S subunit
MSNNWPKGILRELAIIEMGQSPRGETCNQEGIGTPLLNGPTEFGDYYPTPVQFTTDVRKLAIPNDILFCVRGSTTGRMNWADQEYAIGRGIAAMRHRSGSGYRYFLRAMIDFHLDRLLASATGSTFPNVSREQLENLDCKIPPLPEQRAIAGILGALDDKIEANRRMNTTLEAIARAVFRQRFLDSEEVGTWEVGKFSDISDIGRETITPNQFPDETFNHYSIPSFDEKRFPKKELGMEIMSNKFIIPDACVLISKLNPETQRIWIPFQIEGRSICSTEFLANIPKGYFSLEYLHGLFSSQPFQDRFTSMITGTSGSHQRVKAEYVLDMETQIPPKKLVVDYTETAKPLLQKVQQNILESRALANLRDSLLPKLMRGEVRVKDII